MESWKVIVAICSGIVVLSAYVVYSSVVSDQEAKLRQEFIQRARGFIDEFRAKNSGGYDVGEARRLAAEAAKAFRRGEYGDALKLLEMAMETLEKAEKIEPKPWSICESNIMLNSPPEVEDFVPIGVTYIETEDHILQYTPDDPNWVQSCFIIVAVGETQDGEHTLLYQGRLPLTCVPCFEEALPGAFRIRVYVDGEWYYPITFVGPMYYDGEGRQFEYPTVYNYDTTGKYIQTLSYNREGREWIHIIRPLEGGGFRLEMHGYARSTFWMGKMEGPYIVHGVYHNNENLDIWGGFWEVGTMTLKLEMPDVGTYTFNGTFLFDRAVHRSYPGVGRGSVLAFTCLFAHQEEFDLMLSHSVNPSPGDYPSFQHQAKICFPNRGEWYPLLEFNLTDDGKLQPETFHITGVFEAGTVNITGRVFESWPAKWPIGRGTWWDPDGKRTWGRAFISWTGYIILNGQRIEVDAVGVAELTRFQP